MGLWSLADSQVRMNEITQPISLPLQQKKLPPGMEPRPDSLELTILPRVCRSALFLWPSDRLHIPPEVVPIKQSHFTD